jgi:hypothetical protein
MNSSKKLTMQNLRGLLLVATLSLLSLTFCASASAQLSRERVGGRLDGFKQTSAPTGKTGSGPSDNSSPITIEAANSYVFNSATNGTFTDMSTGTTQIVAPGADDVASAVTNIGFEFYFLGTRYTQFSANSNGYVRLGGTAVSTTQYTLGTANVPLIAALGSDLIVSTTGKVHYKVTGAAPNRVLTIEFLNETIIYDGVGTSTDGTSQVRLHERTGVIDLVYGAMNRNSSTGFGGGMDAQYMGFSINSTANNFASLDTANTVSTTALNANQFPLSAPMASLNSPTDGSRRIYTFTPPVPTAPTALTFTSVTPTSMTLNWTDSPDETIYAIYRSADGTNYTFVNTAAQNATSFNATSLSSTTNYFWQVYAVSDGALSTALASSQATTAPGNISSTAAGGLWSVPATWVGGVVPTSADIATIVDGSTVTIDTAAVAFGVNVGQGASGVLQFDTAVARTLTVPFDVSIGIGGTLRSGASGTVTTHVLSVGGNLTNNGTLDFSTNANTAGAGITFTGATSNTFGGSGLITNIRTITVNKGTSNANIIELNPTSFSVQGTTTDSAAAAYLTLTNGTFKISGTFPATFRTFTAAAYAIPATTGFWLNNPNYIVAPQNGSPTVTGLLRVSNGTLNVGTALGNSMGFANTSTITVEGGAINTAGRFGVAAAANVINYTQSGGTITANTVGHTSTTLASFDLGTSLSSVLNVSGGTIILQLAGTGASGPRDYRNAAGSGISAITGGTLQLGNAASGAAKTFFMTSVVPNLVISNASAGHTGTFLTPAINYNDIALNVNINPTTTLVLPNTIYLQGGQTITNNGTLTGTGASSRLYWFGSLGFAQNYTGNGIVTPALTSFDIDNALGVTIDPASTNIVTTRVIMFTGNLTNSNKITLGNSGATGGTVQIGNTTTPTAAGSFDVPFTFNLGTGGETISYLRTSVSRTTGGEINPARTLVGMTYDDNDPTHTLTIAGGNLTATGTLSLVNGRIITGANTLFLGGAGTVTRTAGQVEGNFTKTYAAAGSKVFEVGTANGYSPVTVNATAGTFPANFSATATQGPQPAVNPGTSVQRYWTLNGTGITADLTFQYLAADVIGTEANYRVIRVIGGTSVSFPTSTVNTGTHTASLTGVSTFSDWTVGETSAPTAAPATVRGQITGPDGHPLGGVIVNLGGSQSARTITGADGLYRFDNVETGKLYFVKPDRANYSFSPSERTFSLNADKTDAVFTATPASIPTGNPLDADLYFVRQQYLDFLGREPDHDGLLYWTSEMEKCGADANCLSARRVDISAAFFMEAELQQTGSYVYRLYKGALGRKLSYEEFSADRQKVVGGDDLEASKKAFADEFVKRREFTEKYSQATGAESFVDTLLASMQQTSGADLSNQRSALIESYNSARNMNEGRALALTKAIEVAGFKDAEYNPSFVLMEYFGYLKRNPEIEGFQFWLNVLDNKEPGNYRGMVCSFITSAEYQLRFSPVMTHSNRECR